MKPQFRSVGKGFISVWGKELLESIIGNTAGLRESIHAFVDLCVNCALVDKLIKVVQFHNLIGDHCEGNAYVFVKVHWCLKVKVFKINCHEMGIRSG